jgi:D-threonate/D-erythronate kinase
MIGGDRIAVIADDYTGAADSGIQFARYGRRVELLLRIDGLSRCVGEGHDVSLTSETRFLDPGEATAVVRDLVRRCREAGCTEIFKKIDSTMRGNPGAEIEAALSESGRRAALICTAMPRTGRTCLHGTIYLDGLALDLSDIGRDPFHPLATARVDALLAQQTRLPMGFLRLEQIAAGAEALRGEICAMLARGLKLIIADAVDDGHLAALADQLVHGDLLPVGAGGFAEAMARVFAFPAAAGTVRRKVDLHRPILSVIGSLADASRRQALAAAHSGRFRTIDIEAEVDANLATATATATATAPEPPARFMDAGDGAGPNILLRVAVTDRPDRLSRQSGEKVAEQLGRAASDICAHLNCRTIVSTGGSTSMAIAQALGIESVDLVDEILPGVVAGACNGHGDGVEWFISKAGGFGEDGLLLEIDDRCTQA